MNGFFVEGCGEAKTYIPFVRYMVANSDAFSLVFFRHNSQEQFSDTSKELTVMLEPCRIYSAVTNSWPGFETLNYNHHIYELNVFRTCTTAAKVLSMVDSLWAWDYPKFPMDLCFYKNGYAWFASSAHETWNQIYVENEQELFDLKSLGLRFVNESEIAVSELYKDERTLKKNMAGGAAF